MLTALDSRLNALQQWLHQTLPGTDFVVAPLAGDASFRRYFRVSWKNTTAVVMDAPVEKEDLRPYLKVAEGFAARGLHVPQILAKDTQQGFLLLSDLGDELYLKLLNPQNADQLYGDALNTLVQIQTCNLSLPSYNHALLLAEMMLFKDWYLARHLNLSLTHAENNLLMHTFEQLIQTALQQPQVCVHRDYHSRNLLRLTNANVGILDFQDAVHGPITYDVVSLLRDCYIVWPREKIEAWVQSYLTQAISQNILSTIDPTLFLKWFDWMGMQRHLKCMGIFTRLYRRDHKPGYLNDIPRVYAYLREVSSRYPELQSFHQFLIERAAPQ